MSSGTKILLNRTLQYHETPDAKLAYRVVGQGPPLLMIHGFPLHGLTYRQLVPALYQQHTCVVVDVVGAGESQWNARTDFSFTAHALRLRKLMRDLGYDRYSVLAHDSGGSIARHLALAAQHEVQLLTLINTEIPGWRPPWIPLFQQLLRLPGRAAALQVLMRWSVFRRSGAGFGGCFWDKQLIGHEQFLRLFVEPLIRERRRAMGVCRFLAGLDWDENDAFAHRHAEIACPVLLIWGRDDPTFPYELACQMAPQFPHCLGIHPIERAKLFPHEERPDELLAILCPVLNHSLSVLK